MVPVTAPGNSHVWHVFALLCDRRDELQQHLTQSGVPTLIYYPLPLHLQKCYADQGWKAGDYPVAESVSRRILPLPMFHELAEAQVEFTGRGTLTENQQQGFLQRIFGWLWPF